MQQHLPRLLLQGREPLVEQHELDGVEEVRLARAVPAHDHIVLGTERLDLRLRPKAPKTRYHHLLDVHICQEEALPETAVFLLLCRNYWQSARLRPDDGVGLFVGVCSMLCMLCSLPWCLSRAQPRKGTTKERERHKNLATPNNNNPIASTKSSECAIGRGWRFYALCASAVHLCQALSAMRMFGCSESYENENLNLRGFHCLPTRFAFYFRNKANKQEYRGVCCTTTTVTVQLY